MEAFQYKTGGVGHFEEVFLRYWSRDLSETPSLASVCFLELQKYARLNGLTLDVRRLENPSFSMDGHFMVDASLRAGTQVWTSFGDGDTVKEAWAKAIFELCERFFFDRERRAGLKTGFFLGALEMREASAQPDCSNGVACHRSPQQAVAAALLEAIERDAFMCHWLTGRPMTRLRLTGVPEVEAFSGLAERKKLRFALYSLRGLGGVPTVMAASWSEEGERSQLSIGSAAGWTLHDAGRRAMREMIRLQSFSHSTCFEEQDEESSLEFAMGRFFFYQKRENFGAIRGFFDSADPETPAMDVQNERVMTLEEVMELGRELQVTIYPICGIPSLSDKLFTCWVQSPRLQGLSFRLDAGVNESRLEEFMEGASFTLNKRPHPFA